MGGSTAFSVPQYPRLSQVGRQGRGSSVRSKICSRACVCCARPPGLSLPVLSRQPGPPLPPHRRLPAGVPRGADLGPLRTSRADLQYPSLPAGAATIRLWNSSVLVFKFSKAVDPHFCERLGFRMERTKLPTSGVGRRAAAGGLVHPRLHCGTLVPRSGKCPAGRGLCDGGRYRLAEEGVWQSGRACCVPVGAAHRALRADPSPSPQRLQGQVHKSLHEGLGWSHECQAPTLPVGSFVLKCDGACPPPHPETVCTGNIQDTATARLAEAGFPRGRRGVQPPDPGCMWREATPSCLWSRSTWRKHLWSPRAGARRAEGTFCRREG